MADSEQIKYEKIETQIFFTDGEIMSLTHLSPDECFNDIKDLAKIRYVDSVRIELF